MHTFSQDINILPKVTIFDIYNYLAQLQSEDYTHDKLRDYTKLEGYGMMKDSHVLDLFSAQYLTHPHYFAVTGKVQPRTKEVDPQTK